MTTHTPGRLFTQLETFSVNPTGDCNLSFLIRTQIDLILIGEVYGCDDMAEANARRLVACWNYAETLGMSTEEIELAEQPFYSRRKLEAERGELLEALRRIEGATMSMYATRSDMLEDCQDIARAAIAKATGENA